MNDTALIIFGIVISVLGSIAICGMPFHYRGELKRARARAEQQFRGYSARSSDGVAILNGASAEILDRSDSYTSSNGRIHDYVLTLFVLSSERRHFLFKSNESGKPFVVVLSPERAKLVLKDKYRGEAAGDA